MSFSLDRLLQPIEEEETLQKPVDAAKTIQTQHNAEINKLRSAKEQIQELRTLLTAKQAKLDEVEKDFVSPNIVVSGADIQLLSSRNALETEIKELQKKIKEIESGDDVTDYFLRVGDLLFSYSDAQERIAVGENPVENNMKKGRIPKNSVYSHFMNEDDTAVMVNTIANKEEYTKKASDISNTIGFRRDKAMETYLAALNPDNLHHDAAVANSISEDYGTCPVCDTEMYLNETFLDCPGCGFRDVILIDSEKPSYKDPPREMSYYAYKKINHLNEWLAQFQAKETTEISPAVLEQIKTELKKERITDMSKLKPSKLKEVIKKLKLNRCYDHVAHVLNRLNGISAPVLSREVEEKLRFMFKEIQFSFVKHCPKKRSNFLSYSFVLYKFCELLELDDYLPCFPLLKSREKLYMQDKIWQKICEDMRWEFIRTV
jgi:hypothetical protein